MAQGYFFSGRHESPANFDYFFRNAPFDGGFVVFAGLHDLLEFLDDLSYTSETLDHLQNVGFDRSFLDYLEGFRFSGSVYSCREGEIVFPDEPILRIEGTLLETQIVETALLNLLNFESLVATKATRIVRSAAGASVIDFGLRRAQGFGGIHGSRAAIIGGCSTTSNMFAARRFGIESTGTMAHSWIQVFGNDVDAFRAYARHYPDRAILLVDTFNTLSSGIPAAITVAKELEERGSKLVGIRLDSGDLAYLTKHARSLLDDAGLQYVKIFVSSQLDEYLIRSLHEQRAAIDAFGVGTRLITGYPDAALDGVYKLSSINGKPKQKLSDDPSKTTLPGVKSIYRYSLCDAFQIDGVVVDGEEDPEWIVHPVYPKKRTRVADLQSESLLHCVMHDGKIKVPIRPLSDLAEYVKHRLGQLPEEHRRFEFPHPYRVGLSEELRILRDTVSKQSAAIYSPM